MKYFWNCLHHTSAVPHPFCCWLLPIWPKLDFWAENWAYVLCQLCWQYNRAKLYFPWPSIILPMIWNTSETFCITPQLWHSHLSCWFLPIWHKLDFWAEIGAYGLCRFGWRYNGSKLYFYRTYMIVSMIWNTYELSPSHLRPATSIIVVGCCQFGPSWMFGLKIGAYGLCWLGWRYNGENISFSWPYIIVSMIWNTS